MNFLRSSGYVARSVVTGTAVAITLLLVAYFFASNFFTAPLRGQSSMFLSRVEEQAAGVATWTPSRYAVYFNNTELNKDGRCEEVYPVPREAEEEGKVVSLLLSLFSGPTDEERKLGFSSFFSEATASILKSVSVRNGVAAVNLADIRSVLPNVSSSCGSQAFMSSVERTLYQFDNIDKVIFAIDGDPEAFYEWVQLGCSEENNNCDASMFR